MSAPSADQSLARPVVGGLARGLDRLLVVERGLRLGEQIVVRLALRVARLVPEVALLRILFVLVDGLRRVALGLRERGGCEAPGVMLVMPEYIDFDTKLLQADHHTVNALAHHTAAVAILCHGQEIADWFKLYFAYYPPAFAVAYFSAYPKAYAWLVANTPKGPES